jgi:hypothetical protein
MPPEHAPQAHNDNKGEGLDIKKSLNLTLDQQTYIPLNRVFSLMKGKINSLLPFYYDIKKGIKRFNGTLFLKKSRLTEAVYTLHRMFFRLE